MFGGELGVLGGVLGTVWAVLGNWGLGWFGGGYFGLFWGFRGALTPPISPPPRLLVGLMDEDGDGGVSLGELRGWISRTQRRAQERALAQAWGGHDRDGDGRVTWDEYREQSYGQPGAGRGGAPGGGRGGPELVGEGGEVLGGTGVGVGGVSRGALGGVEEAGWDWGGGLGGSWGPWVGGSGRGAGGGGHEGLWGGMGEPGSG